MPHPTILQLVTFDPTGDTHHRMRWPGAQLAQQRPDWRVINLSATAAERFQWAEHADLLVIYQSHDLDLLPVIEKRKLSGRKTLVEYNDNFYAPPPSSPVFSEWVSPLIWQNYEAFMKRADGIIVTCENLGKLFDTHVRNEYHVLENHSPFELDTRVLEKKSPLKIGWAGSIGHAADLLALVPTLQRVMNDNPSIFFGLMGNNALPGLVRMPEDRFFYQAWSGMAEYFQFLQKLDLGIITLLDTPYNRCRSDIKAIELASQGVLPAIPESAVYREFVWKTGVPTWSDLGSLKSLLQGLLSNPDQMKILAKRCFDYVHQERLGPRRKERAALYEKYLPEILTSFEWPVGSGFHEVQGLAAPRTVYTESINVAAKRLNEGNAQGARQVLERAVKENPGNADLVYSLAEVLFACEASEHLVGFIRDAIRQYPRDIRFRLKLTIIDPGAWAQVFDFLENFPASSLATYEEVVCSSVIEYLMNAIELPTWIFRAEKIFPNNMRLELGMAEWFEKAGKNAEALEYFQKLEKTYHITAKNQEICKELTPGFAKTWIEACKARKTFI